MIQFYDSMIAVSAWPVLWASLCRNTHGLRAAKAHHGQDLCRMMCPGKRSVPRCNISGFPASEGV